MSSSRKERHRDREPGQRWAEENDPPQTDRVFRITDAQRREIAQALRYIDEARMALQSQHDAEHREIIRELRASADRIFDVLNDVEEIGD